MAFELSFGQLDTGPFLDEGDNTLAPEAVFLTDDADGGDLPGEPADVVLDVAREHLGAAWFEHEARAAREVEALVADGFEGRLVSMYTFTEPWTTWEVHPNGHEVVVCTAGSMTLHQEINGKVRTVTLNAGDATINAPGVWHTADVDAPTTALFITAGMGTQVRPR